MISDPSAIPETEHDAAEHLAAAEEAFASHRPDEAIVLARALGEAHVAPAASRARAFRILGSCLEQRGEVDAAIDAYRRSGAHGDPAGDQDAHRLQSAEPVGLIEAGRPPANEAEAILYMKAAKAAMDASDHERAYELYLAVHGSDVSDASQRGQAAYGLGVTLRALGSHDAAYQYFREASEQGSTDIRGHALRELEAYNRQGGTTGHGQDHPSSEALTSAEAVATMLQAAIDRYDVDDRGGAAARFTAVHGAQAATTEQRAYAAYYLGVLAWHGHDYDVARVHFREAAAGADEDTKGLAAQMLRQHWGE